MKVIDAFTGRSLKVGDSFSDPSGDDVTLMAVRPGAFSASALLRYPRKGLTKWVELQVRWTHPSYFLKHVAFVPS